MSLASTSPFFTSCPAKTSIVCSCPGT
ncbi:hypothetical protein VCHC56A1_1994, partial [Vibrio cholerae HC-56A1]